MKSTLPKQFMELSGKPVLMHTLDAFQRYSKELSIILVIPADEFTHWNELVVKHRFNIPVTLQSGGETRFQSVKRGLEKISGSGLVAIHDGVRPLVTPEIIGASFRLAAEKGTAIAAVPSKDSIRIRDADSTRAVDRSKHHLIQTPQTFNLELIQAAYLQPEDHTFTDDASVAEKAGHSISLFEGSYENVKITTVEDLVVAEAFLAKRVKL
jgi:2-C-methyl-D-erythritol 4-phosphate cytidylyltransferase